VARKTARKRKTRRKTSSRRSDEVLGLILLAASAFLAVSLYSYDAADGDLFVHLAERSPVNLGGSVGATLAAVGFQLLGVGAWATAAACASLGWMRFRSREIPAAFTKVVGCSALLIFGCILVHYALGPILLGGHQAAAGGLLGTWGGTVLQSSFGPFGAPLVATTAFLLSLVAVTKLSLARLARSLWDTVIFVGRHFRTSTTRWRERRRKSQQRQAVIKKYTAKKPQTDDAHEAEAGANPAATGAFLTLKVPVTGKRPGAPRPETPEPEVITRVIEPTALLADPEPLPFEQPAGPHGEYALPDFDLLHGGPADLAINQKELMEKAKAITSKAAEFRVTGEVVAIHPGPVVTTFEFRPGTGVKYSRITSLEDDLSLALKAESIRIARLPGNHQSKLALAIGKQIHGETIITDLARMPHLLIAGTTGSGKSVALNSMLLSLLYKATPDEVKLVLIDPKRLEFGLYEDIPHLLTPVVVEPKLAANALAWAVREMENRYKLLAEYGVRSIDQFNLILKRGGEELDDLADAGDIKPLPYIVVVIDELADLMMTSSNVVEEAIVRLSQMARAVGIHLILATQRPSVDVLTGVIKNNLPARMSFRVASKVDSRVILDTQGAETLLGKGDMLFLAPGTSRISRVHGAYVDEEEVKGVVRFWRAQARPAYTDEVVKAPPEAPKGAVGERNRDEYFADAVRVVVTAGEASVSNIQRKLSLGYARAGRIMDMMESEGIVGPPQGSKPRRVLVDSAFVDGL